MGESESAYEHSRLFMSFERFQKATAQDIVLIKESMGIMSQTQGEMLRKAVETERDIDGVRKALTKMADELNKRNAICDGRHEDIDERLDSISDVEDISFDADTGVYESMGGHEVKNIIAEEKRAREALQKQVDAMRQQDEIHRAEKSAVKKAKQEWDRKNKGLEEEQGKIKTARYGMYAAIGVAAISAAATISVSILNLMNDDRPVAEKVEGEP